MKKFIFLLFLFAAFNGNAQSYMPDGSELDCNQPLCPPILAENDPLMDSMTSAADAIGKARQGDPCADYTYAHILVCTVVEEILDVLPCMYPASTPQGSLCVEGDQPSPPDSNEPAPEEPSPDEPETPEPPTTESPQSESYYATPHTRPVVWKVSEKYAKSVSQQLEKLELGKPHFVGNGGLQLIPIRAERHPKNPSQWVIVYRLVDANGRTVGNPILISYNGKMVLWDLASKKKGKSSKSKYRRR